VTLGGILPVLQTPFDDRDGIDLPSLARLVTFAAQSGAAAVVYPANASEFYALSHRERMEATATVFEAADGLPVIACVTGDAADEVSALSCQARKRGATAVMAIPPRSPLAGVIEYFQRCAREAGLPIILQSVRSQFGGTLDEAALDQLLDAVPEIEYIKEERSPTTHTISHVVARYDGRLRGVIGGANGQWLVQESLRGACGCMPAGALVDVQVPIYQAIESGNWARARMLQARLQPLLAYTSIYGVSMVKEILFMRGLAPSARTRDQAAVPLDDDDRVELKHFLERLPVFRVEDA
jgi:4-hydroxy-tetrahydrodipicolinate synthase